MEEIRQIGWLVVDFFTHSYRISGHLDVRRQCLFEMLNDRTTRFLQLEDAYISPIDRPGEILASYSASTLAKANLTLAMVARQEDALPRKQVYGSYMGAHLYNIFLTVPTFEISGYLRLSARVDLRRLLVTEGEEEEFLVILDGRVRGSVRPDIVFNAGGILVNKRHIGAFCMEESR
ncbi:MAG: hypothetical protein RML46_01480 [Anaerolineae bacterium]|nr:hypothetical protein [Anaerolineae bacterium]